MDVKSYVRLQPLEVKSSYCSQINGKRTPFRPAVPIDNSIMELFIKILTKPILCWHDVEDINQIYCSLDAALRDESSFSITTSMPLSKVIEKVQAVLVEKPKLRKFEDILSVYHLQNFVESCGFDVAFAALRRDFSEGDKARIAFMIPFCRSEEQFNHDVASLLGSDLNERLTKVIEQKRKLLIEDRERRRTVEDEKVELVKLQQGDFKNYPAYLNEILDNGFLSLYLHLITMRALPNRNARIEACEQISFSEISRIVLETRAAIIKKVKEAMPANWKDCEITFLIGGSGAGKSTTLSFLRGDKMERQGSCYASQGDMGGIIGNEKAISCTFLPNIETVSDRRIIGDLAGFDDSSGPLVGLGMELALIFLIKRYGPKVIVLESITNVEDRYATAARLGARLSRLLANKDHCVLGITKYVQNSDFVRLESIEAQQRMELSAPSKEEITLEAEIALLETLVLQMPSLEVQLNQKREKFADLQRARTQFSLGNLPDTEEKIELRRAIQEIENQLLTQIGLTHLARFAHLEMEDSLATCIQALSELPVGKVLVNHELSLEISDERLLEQRFQHNLREELESKKGYHLDFEDNKKFRQRVLDTSLIKAITPWAPQIGEFLHLPEMNARLVRGYSRKVVENCIVNYIEGIIAELQISTIQMVLTRFPKYKSSKQLETETVRLKNYIMGLKGLGHLLGEKSEEADQEWINLEAQLRQAREAAGNSVVKSFELGSWATLGLALPIGIPLGIYKLVGYIKSNNARFNAENQVIEQLIEQALSEVKGLFDQVVQLKEVEKIIMKQEEIDAAFDSIELRLESKKQLRETMVAKINFIKDLYGAADWEARTMALGRPGLVLSANSCVDFAVAAFLLDDSVSVFSPDSLNKAGIRLALESVSIYSFWNTARKFDRLHISKGDITLDFELDWYVPMILLAPMSTSYSQGNSRALILDLDLRSSLSRTLMADVLLNVSGKISGLR